MVFVEKDEAVVTIDDYELIHPYLAAGDVVFDRDGFAFLLTQDGLDCDCGKGLYCPAVQQGRVTGKGQSRTFKPLGGWR